MSNRSAEAPTAWAQRMGYGGLIPFVGLAAVFWIAGPDRPAWIAPALLGYGAVIASFLGALHWGLLMRQPAQQSLALLGWGVTPSLLAWVALLAGPAWGLLGLAAILWVCLAVDRVLYPRFGVPGWLPMRLNLTAVASVCCALVGVGSF